MSPSRPRPRRRNFNTKPFSITLLVLTLLASCAFLSHVGRDVQPYDPGTLATRDLDILSKKNRECRLVHSATNKCKYVRKYCADENAGLIPYLTLYYCSLGNAQPIAFLFLVAWAGMLFTTIGIAASDFFSVNLSTIASIMGLSESLAGVTFLAFGNGSPDVFSTFAAMGSNSSSMAVGELVGAAGFITAVVAGSMALVREFKVSKRTYVRDICFFIVAATFTMVILLDGNLTKWECGCMIGFYIFYVVIVVGWHWYITSRKRRRAREVASRTNFYGITGLAGDDLEPYRDGEEDEERTAGSGRARDDTADISVLENGSSAEDEEDDEDDDERDHRSRVHVAAEMTSSMRVMRPRGRRSTTTITPIRPSLVGALEFRSVLYSLQKERNMRLKPLPHGHGRSRSVNYIETNLQPVIPEIGEPVNARSLIEPEFHTGLLRDRAFSSGDVLQAYNNMSDSTIEGSPSLVPLDVQESSTRGPSPPSPFKVDGKLAPPPAGAARPQSPQLQLQIPTQSQPTSERSSPAVSPFPAFVDSPMPISPSLPSLPSPSIDPGSGFTSVDVQNTPRNPRPVKWWPYSFLPPPHVLTSTFFPPLQQWSDKSVWDKFVSIISAPSIFLLVVTLPVVETDTCDEDSDGDIVDIPENGSVGYVPPAVLAETEAAVGPDTEWQRYRRTSRSREAHSPNAPSPLLISVESPGATRAPPMATLEPSPQPRAAKPAVSSRSEASGLDEPATWNRWLVSLQVVTGPLFVVFILWANMQDEFEDPGKMLFKLVLYALLFSMILLAFLLLTTTAEARPKYYYLLCFLGFIISIAWISTVAGEVVGVLKAFGVILGISEAILGLTIFAVGNSLGDLVADVTVARLGYPMMALSACFGGPMLNILLGIGLGGLFYNKGLHIEVGGTLIISAISLLVTLVALLVTVPMNKWIMSRKIGWGLIGLWSVSTIANLVIEVSGVWRGVE